MLPENKLIKTKKQMLDTLAIERPFYVKKHNILGWLFSFSERAILWRHQIYLRKAEYHTNAKHKIRALFYKILLLRLQIRYSLAIPLNVCEAGLHIMHLGPILINGKCQIGKNVSIHINTALVAKGTSPEAPILEDGVVIGVGAVIVGKVHIAKNVAIGANAVVTKDVNEENVAVAGNPAKIISQNGRLAWKNKVERN